MLKTKHPWLSVYRYVNDVWRSLMIYKIYHYIKLKYCKIICNTGIIILMQNNNLNKVFNFSNMPISIDY